MQQLELISPKELDRYVGDSDALVIDIRDSPGVSCFPYKGGREYSIEYGERKVLP